MHIYINEVWLKKIYSWREVCVKSLLWIHFKDLWTFGRGWRQIFLLVLLGTSQSIPALRNILFYGGFCYVMDWEMTRSLGSSCAMRWLNRTITEAGSGFGIRQLSCQSLLLNQLRSSTCLCLRGRCSNSLLTKHMWESEYPVSPVLETLPYYTLTTSGWEQTTGWCCQITNGTIIHWRDAYIVKIHIVVQDQDTVCV